MTTKNHQDDEYVKGVVKGFVKGSVVGGIIGFAILGVCYLIASQLGD